jgi:hypothetical protein
MSIFVKTHCVAVFLLLASALSAATNQLNCGFDNPADVRPGNQWGFLLSNVTAPHSSYKVEGSCFKAYINKSNVTTGVNFRGRSEVGIYPLITAPQGKKVSLRLKYFAPSNCSFTGNPANQVGNIAQLQEEGGQWRPLFLLIPKPSEAKTILSIYKDNTGNPVSPITIATGDPRGTTHTIELWAHLTTGTDGYYDVRYDNGTKIRVYKGRTLPTGSYPLDWKCGSYSAGDYAFKSEVWIHENYISW